MESTFVLVVFACHEHGVDISQGKHLLSLLCLSSNLCDGPQPWVQIAGAEEVTSIEGINCSISLDVIHIERKFDYINFLLVETVFL